MAGVLDWMVSADPFQPKPFCDSPVVSVCRCITHRCPGAWKGDSTGASCQLAVEETNHFGHVCLIPLMRSWRQDQEDKLRSWVRAVHE